MPHRALITAGGRGTRLRPLTHTNNKHLIPIANKPMIHFALEAVAAAGIREAGIVINPDTGEEIRRALGDGAAWGLQLTYVMQEAPLGLAHVVRCAESFLKQEPFVFYLGDNVVVGGIRQFLERFQARGDQCHLVLARVKDPQRFGVAEIAGDRVASVVEKPKMPKSQFAVTGIYVYDSPIFEAVHAIVPSARGELEISDAHQYLLDRGYRVGFSEITGWWKDTGKPEDLLEANRVALEQLLDGTGPVVQGSVDEESDVAGKVLVEAGARILASQVRGPAIIGADAVIERSYVGPFTAIGARCHLRDSELEYSILFEDTAILEADVRIERSLLGREVIIRRCSGRPKTQKFILGDQSIVELC
ncbi:MAG: glucose-1-phosphate thymidylyltransferase [candidate division NC10 bacterium]|nr:glucose-1-phosphate thymidylyltransferase [candidate division NC10 bacterium]